MEAVFIVNFGIVGCGYIAGKHANALEQIANARLVAACDTDLKRRTSFEEQYGVSTYENYDDFLKNPDVEAVIICTPSGSHATLGEKAAHAGKHILLEKPFVLDINQGKNLVELCKSKRVKVGVVHPNRVKTVVRALNEAVSEGWFGKITHASAVLRWNRSSEYFNSAAWRGTLELDGGMLFNQAIHNIDLFNWLLGPVDEVFAYGATQLHKIEYEDVCVCTLKLKSGALGMIEAAITLYPENLEESLAVFGSQGTAVLGGKSLSKIKEWKFSKFSEADAKIQIDQLNNESDPMGHKVIIEDFIRAITCNQEPLVSGEEAMKVLYLLNAIYQSIKTNQPVKITTDWSENM
ncbi:MAG: Gfo/Idh/MocA family oxidoreductase [Anaerolineaceae bacterium]|nr:MAG: Gfo/Idh/MocA family oxidoreductase [Anaerolineaceae bacterium]